jgi:signal transduction histidine kinase
MKGRPPRSANAESAPLTLEAFAAGLMDSLGCALLLTDPLGRICYRNLPARRMLPAGDDAPSVLASIRVLGRFDDWPTELARVVRAHADARFAGAVLPANAKSPLLVTVRCYPLALDDGPLTSGVLIRVEEEPLQEAAEDKLEVSKRLAALGKLAARVAHELNNPLDGILRYINLALRQVGDPSESTLKTYLSESRTGLMRMVQIIGDVLAFTRDTGDLEEAGINEIVEESLRAVADRLQGRRIVVAVDFQSPRMPRTRGSRLYQVCCNLIRNASDAMPEGGRLSITTAVVDQYVVLRVADTGPGLSAAAQKLFEPFFTTKPAGMGTGLGLAISRDFVESMNGTITAADGPEGGAVFTVRIPLSSFQAAKPALPPDSASPDRNGDSATTSAESAPRSRDNMESPRGTGE